ncbi:MAG TPA: beta-ketoacyl-ACP synthase III [Oscillospiraceae bacterium]|nr:beta-ketoacyl-ACP synthase III [Oscillospiraceae bacterium]HPF55582.1 beta-ketoacyl-ACP synthase III [Clostridiales bacterium]HPK35817.1 beta-ketoacyl-ACP synthase III [Oscillospiraceae bacterium]HPR76335.1 beta-ketoacyl-ACP synthase III [Oscillospiraceae bacterium]
MSFQIVGTGMCVPERVVTNGELSQLVETSDEWISQRVGVRSRHICTSETTADLAVSAAQRALDDCGLKAEELDLILAASVSADTVTPALSCAIQKRLGVRCMAFDISAACSAFVFMLETAACFFARGGYRNILIVGAERLSRITDWEDRSTCVIFGDGAGAAVLSKGENYLDAVFTVTGDENALRVPFYAGKSPFSELEPESPYIRMNGKEIFRFAVQSMIQDINTLLQRNGLTPDDLKAIIPHQANRRIIEAAAERSGIPIEKFLINIDRYGNTSSASIPIALDELNKAGELKRGDLILLTAFGGGLASASCLLRW